MESLKKLVKLLYPKTYIGMISKEIDTPYKKDSLFKRYIRFISKRILVIYACCHLICYKHAVSILGFIAGRFLVKHQIVPYHIFKPGEVKEDPGVTEMRAMLRGEDCFDYNLDQSQHRTNLPGDINPYEETYLVSFHFSVLCVIRRLLESLKKHDEPYAQSFNGLFTWFDKLAVGYLNTEIIMNKRD